MKKFYNISSKDNWEVEIKMSLKPEAIPVVPELTVQVARSAFPKGNIYMQMRDMLGSIYRDDQFIHLYPSDRQPAVSPWRLALVTVMQFAENLSDRQAADAVRFRLDWKYALSLELTDAGFHYSVLSEFRSRVVAGGSGEILLEILLKHLVEAGLLEKTRSTTHRFSGCVGIRESLKPT